MNDDRKKQFKRYGHKLTRPRMLVLEYLQDHDPTTTSALILAVGSQANRASVYRSLSLFRRLGIVQDVVHAGQKMIELTDDFDIHHHHISCTSCGGSKVIEDKVIESALVRLAAKNGFALTQHQLSLSGVCHACQDSYKTLKSLSSSAHHLDSV